MKLLILSCVLSFVLFTTAAFGQSSTLFSIDRIHSKIGFSIGYAGGVIDAEGCFNRFSGTVSINPNNVSDIKASIIIEANSIDTGVRFRDNDLRSANWFDAEQFPNITFTSKSVKKENDKLLLIGNLTMRGVTKEVALNFQPTTDKFIQGPGRLYVGFDAHMELNRQDYGIHMSDPDENFWKYNDIMESTGEMFVSNIVNVKLKILAVHSGREILTQAVSEKGIEAGYEYYKQQQKTVSDGRLLFHERDLNTLGYQYLGEKKVDEAIKIFTYYVQDYPESANAYDSLGEAYMTAGMKDMATQNYQKSLKLDPENENAQKMLEKLESM